MEAPVGEDPFDGPLMIHSGDKDGCIKIKVQHNEKEDSSADIEIASKNEINISLGGAKGVNS